MALLISLKVVPNTGSQKCSLDKSNTLKITLKSSAEKGKANAELIKLLSKKLKLPQEKVSIVLGTTARKKRIKIDADIRREQLLTALGIEKQKNII